MVDRELLEKLACPETRMRLANADPALIARLNAAIAAGRLVNRAGHRLERAIEGGLIREDGQVLYPVIDRIPSLLVDRAIPLAQVNER